MPSNYTANYKLNQWSAGDRVVHTDFNADNAKIDAALAGKASAAELNTLRASVASKAEQSVVDALITSKAEQSAVDALSTSKADASALSRLQRQVGWLEEDALQATTGSYVGTGKCNSSNATVLTFPRLPVLLVVRKDGFYDCLVLVQGLTNTTPSMSSYSPNSAVHVTWDSAQKRVSWYSSNSKEQMNESGETYYYVAIY